LAAVGLAEGNPIDPQAAALWLDLPQQQPQHRAFPPAAGAHQGEGAVGGDGQVELAEPAATGVAELHLLDGQLLPQLRWAGLNPPDHRRPLLGAPRRRQLVLQQVQGGRGGLQRQQGGPQLPHATDHGRGDPEGRDQLPDRELLLQHQPGAEGEHAHQGEHRGGGQGGLLEARHRPDPLGPAHQLPVASIEFRAGGTAEAKEIHELPAAQALAGVTEQQAGLLDPCLFPPGQGRGEGHLTHQQQRGEHDRHQGEPPVAGEQQQNPQQQLGDGPGEQRQLGDHHVLEGGNLQGQQALLTAFAAAVARVGLLQEVPEQPLAKARSQLASQRCKQTDGEAIAGHRHQQPGAGQQDEQSHRRAPAGFANDLVDDQLQQHRDPDHQQRVREDREDGQDRLQPLVAEVAPQSEGQQQRKHRPAQPANR